MKKIHLIVGARPNFMKMAPLYREFSKFNDRYEVKLIHTGQHYDEKMSTFFFNELKMPKPDEYLEVGSGSHGEQTGKIMERYEGILLKDKPDLVIVAGDVNSTVACAINAVKLHIPVAHLEAGLRSFDRTMPEEINRIITDSISDLLLIPSVDAEVNLKKEGVSPDKIYFVGNIMIDSLTEQMDNVENSQILSKLGLSKDNFVLVTLHRPSNVDSEAGLKVVLNALKRISEKTTIVFPIHPRTRKNMMQNNLMPDRESIILTEPLGYYDFIKLQQNSRFILTDSGGLQEESTFFRIPCLTLRPNTERPITITMGTNQLVKLTTEDIINKADEILNETVAMKQKRLHKQLPALWDGKTAARTVEVVDKFFSER